MACDERGAVAVTALIALLWQVAPLLIGAATAGGAWLWARRSGRRAERAGLQERASRQNERARVERERPLSRGEATKRMRGGQF